MKQKDVLEKHNNKRRITMKKTKLFSILMLVVFVFITILFIPGCKNEAEQKVIKIGAILPLTGWSAEFGQHERAATEIAVKKLHESYPNWQIQLSVEDTESDVKNAINAFQKMLSTQKPGFILVESSSASLALGKLFDENKIIMLSISANPEVTQKAQFVFRNFPTAEEETEKVLEYALKKLNIKRIGLLYINNDYGLGYKNPFEKYAKELNGELVFTDSYSSETKDFKPVIQKLINSKAEAVYIVGYGSAMGLIIKQLREMNYTGTVLACSSVIYDDVLSISPGSVEGVIFTDIPYDVENGTGETKEFVQEYSKKMGKLPSPLAAMTYDGIMMIIKQLVAENGDPAKARESLLKKGEYEGINGKIGIPFSRDLKYQLIVKEVKGGKGIIIE
ncbi:MAG: penicillin-binding protein activator [Candidatus Aminicenantes bacterium]|nr:penicillin-binding protein activator [Candidatus Aminicenantes bacterium]